MTCVTFFLFLSILVVTHSSHGNVLCTIEDTECLTNYAKEVFNLVVPGINGVIESSDPLFAKEAYGVLPGISYRLSNLTLTGIRGCQVQLLKLNKNDLTYQYNLLCPRLVLNYHHEGTGLFGPVEIDANGSATATYEDYLLKINGKYGRSVDEKDQKLRFYLNGFTLETEVEGKFIYQVHSPLHLKDEAKSQLALAYVMQHTNELEQTLKSSAMEKLMSIYLGNLDIYLRNYGFNIQY